MKKFTVFTIAGLIATFAAACSPAANTAKTTTDANRSTTINAANTNADNAHSAKTEEDAPAAVRAVFPDAQSYTKQHKNIPKDAVAEIEKDTGGKVPDTDHHSYLAFQATGGARRQIGAATVVKADGKDVVIVYENKGGMPTIKEVRADGVPAPFLAQFAGKGHDDKFAVGADVKAGGVDEATAKAIAQAVRIDSMTMQTLYGAAHSH